MANKEMQKHHPGMPRRHHEKAALDWMGGWWGVWLAQQAPSVVVGGVKTNRQPR